ncbi:MAG TPA: DUF6768 family protein [Planctomycetota bacterium]|nr:DUF6768 family protein [Planctomycetota bacterium]
MNEFDDKMREALRAGHRVEIGGQEIGDVRTLVTEIFRFRSKLLAVSSVVKIACAWVMTIVAAVFAFLAEDERSRLLWGLGCVFAIISLSTLWNFHWMMLNRNAVLREIKRLELQLSETVRGERRQP